MQIQEKQKNIFSSEIKIGDIIYYFFFPTDEKYNIYDEIQIRVAAISDISYDKRIYFLNDTAHEEYIAICPTEVDYEEYSVYYDRTLPYKQWATRCVCWGRDKDKAANIIFEQYTKFFKKQRCLLAQEQNRLYYLYENSKDKINQIACGKGEK